VGRRLLPLHSGTMSPLLTPVLRLIWRRIALKKLLNNPDNVAREAVHGLALAYPQHVRQLEGLQAVARRTAPTRGKVAVVTGGGSGHEPMFLGYVGTGMADASVAGNIFASPPPKPIYETAKAVHGGAGVLFLYGNYSGDALNFDIAAEMLEADDIPVRTVRVADDVASAPPEKREERRGIAGDLFVIKIASACAEEGASLEEVGSAAIKANENTRSIGVALSSCIIPASGRPIFEIGENEIEVGMGVHGEPGVSRRPLPTAAGLAGDMVQRLLADLQPQGEDEVALLVNGLGATPLIELFVMFHSIHPLLADAGVQIFRSYVGNYVSSLDMAGCSITLMRLDVQLKRLLLAPAESPAFVQV
jgi:phosphoenolpyruvate---glycerone phosphotransferase subunit DhaK